MSKYVKFFALVVVLVWGQQLPAQPTDNSDLAKEELIVFLNSHVLIPGEELQVAISSNVTPHQFWISRVAYLELLDPNNQPVIQSKVELYEGKGSATLYLPSYLKSGVYTLLVYTQWQRNFGVESIIQRKISLLNPYAAMPKDLFNTQKSEDSLYAEFFRPTATKNNTSIAYQIKNKKGEIVPAQLRIINGAMTVVDLKSEDGYGSFPFDPTPDSTYSVAVIDQNKNVHLSNLALTEIHTSSEDQISSNAIEVSISLNKLTFQPREKIELTLNSTKPINSTLIIQKKQPLENESRNLVSHFFGPVSPFIKTKWPLDDETKQFLSLKKIDHSTDTENTSIKFLPDFRGELIEGRLQHQNGMSSPNHEFYITTTGDSQNIYEAKADSSGGFKVSMDPRFSADQLIFSNISDYNIVLDSSFLGSYDFVKTEPLQLQDVNVQSWLVEKSQQVQIQNIYDSRSAEASQYEALFAGQEKLVYRLDDYARFPTMSDHIIEYIPVVTIRKVNEQREFLIRNIDNRTGNANDVLVTLNGIVCSDEDILNFDPLKIEQIEIYPREFQIGSHVFHGAISFTTFPDTYLPGNQFGSNTRSHLRVQKFTPPGSSTPTAITSPDMRTQLAWEPHFTIEEQNKTLTYYASDVPGTYVVTIVGIEGDNYVLETVEFTITGK